MKRKQPTLLHTPTLIDAHGTRHVTTNGVALCGATGTQDAPRDHRVDTLCLRCRQRYARQIADERMTRFGI